MIQSNPGMLPQVLAGMANSPELDMAVPGAVREEEVPAQRELSGLSIESPSKNSVYSVCTCLGGPLSESESVSESDKPSVSDGQSHQSSSETSDAVGLNISYFVSFIQLVLMLQANKWPVQMYLVLQS